MDFNMSNDGRDGKSVKRKHVTLTIHQKLEIIKRLEEGENRHVIMGEYNIGSSTIYDIKKRKGELQLFLAESDTTKGIDARHTLKKPKLSQLDSALYKWFLTKRSEGKQITGPMLIEKAKDFHQEMKLTEQCAFSEGWLRNFKDRHGIRKPSVSGEPKSANHTFAEDFGEFFKPLIQKHKLSPDQVYNADETGLLWRCLPNSMLDGGDEKCAQGFKRNKDRIAVLVCGNASGRHKLKLFVVGKYKKSRAFNGITYLPVVYDAQENARMTAELFKEWFFHHFVPEVKENFKRLGLPEDSTAILLIDNCKAHHPASELVCGNISAEYLPASVTSLIQPMDQGVIQRFKTAYKGSFIRKLLNSNCIVQDFQASFNLKDAIYAAALAWKDVSSIILQRSWRKIWPSVKFGRYYLKEEEFEGISARQTGLGDILKIMEEAPTENPVSKLTEEEMEEWFDEDGDPEVVEIVTDAQIIDMDFNLNKVKVMEEEENYEGQEGGTRYTWHQATEFITKFVEFAEYNSQYSAAEVMNLHIILNNFYEKKAASNKQADLRDMFKKAIKKAGPCSPTPSTSSTPDLIIVSDIEPKTEY
ncbi:jerky protein-like [Leucoraja erinacea]|uniref:jerky protein-like n=1 Tax=Leucoraja erinaceus TaxID=7782 RepID=UPI002455F778|nr:jerky protein-like [Leucoraja erinacea]